MKNSKYMHGEAFCLMRYRCQKCQSIELLWNSRDGVTPFIIGSACCSGEQSQHINFHQDIPHKLLPAAANRVFIDTTMDKAKEYAQQFWDMHGELMLEKYEHLREIGKDKLMEGKIAECYGDGHRPCVATVDEFKAASAA